MVYRRSFTRLGQVLAVFALAAASGCKVTSVGNDGPTPEITAVTRHDAGFPSDPVLCTTLGGQVRLAGKFAPLPVDVLTDHAGVEIPQVFAVDTAGRAFPLADVTYDSASGALDFAVAPNELVAGRYDLRVVNPNGKAGTATGALSIVAPPTLAAVDPVYAANTVAGTLTFTGTGFWAATSGTQPHISLIYDNPPLNVVLESVSVASASTVTATVPADQAIATYDIRLTNPDGCVAELLRAYEAGPALALNSTVTPALGTVSARTSIEISARAAASGFGLKPVPAAFIVIGGVDIPLLRALYLDTGSATTPSRMSAVVPSASDDPRIVVGGPYAIKVMNPDGVAGLIARAFTVTANQPPHVTVVTGPRGDAAAGGTLLTVIGENFRDGNLPGTGNRILTIALVTRDASGAEIEFACGRTTTVLNVPSVGLATATCTMTLPAVPGLYLVRVRHQDDRAYSDFAAYAVTLAGRPLALKAPAQASLNTPRRAHGLAAGEDDLGGRYLYAAGGENVGGVLASIEVASVSKFGALSGWTSNRVALPEARTGVALVAVGHSLYAIGGSTDGSTPIPDNAAGGQYPVLRAEILGADSMPVVGSAVVGASGSLGDGVYYYRVAAVMKAASSNPLGETLPSEIESVRATSGSRVTLTYSSPRAIDVDHFVIYRSVSPNQVVGTELLLGVTADGTVTTFVDDGSVAPAGASPLPRGSTGAWVGVSAAAGLPTITPRFDHAAVGLAIDATQAYLYVAGGRVGPLATDVTSSVEVASVSANGATLASWATTTALSEARAEHALALVGPEQLFALATPPSAFGLMVAGGTESTRAQKTPPTDPTPNLRIGRVDTANGTIVDWRLGGTEVARVGLTAFVANDYCYLAGGLFAASTSAKSQAAGTREVGAGAPNYPAFLGTFPTGATTFDPGITYRSATAQSAGYFFFVGGSASATLGSTTAVVLRGGY